MATAQDVERDAALSLVATWGLRPERAIVGWSVRSIEKERSGEAVIARFGRGEAAVEVVFRRASDAPRFARVGPIDLHHSSVDPALGREVGELMRAVAGWLGRQPANALAELLASSSSSSSGAAAQKKAPAASAQHAQAYASASGAPPLDPAKRTPADRPFMRFETIDLSEVHRYPDALREMYAGTFGGLVIKNVYDKAAMAKVVEALSREETAFPRTSFPERFKAHFYGRCLDGSDPGLDEYLSDAARFREETLAVFRDTHPYEARMEEMFRALGGGRDVQLPRFTDGRAYTPATIRILLEGGQIGTHCGNEASTRPAYTHLNTRIDRGDQISFFLTLQEPVQGGELIVYSLKWSDVDEAHFKDGHTDVSDLLPAAEWMAIAPTAGDLLLFDGGRYFHRVDVVRGPKIRWTMGGFLMFDRAGSVIHYWS